MNKTYNEINNRIAEGTAQILTAEEMVDLVEQEGIGYAAEAVDVVTTGTFGCMCSSGAFFNLKQPDPPLKIDQIWLDGIPAYHGMAAVDFYLGVTKKVEKKFLQEHPERTNQYPSISYGGGHVLERLVQGKSVFLQATGAPTDGYPRIKFERLVNLNDFNQAFLVNPRNGYQRYNCAVNTSSRVIYTYMGKLYPNLGNGTFGGVGTLSPLNNDPTYRTIGLGTSILLGGAPGVILGEGTQHDPKHQMGTLMVKGNLKEMQPEFLAGATIFKYGVSCFIGLGCAIPILDDILAKTCGIPDDQLFTEVIDYSTGNRARPNLATVSYHSLKTNQLFIDGKHVPVAPLSSIPISRKIALLLKSWIKQQKITPNAPIKHLSHNSECGTLNGEP